MSIDTIKVYGERSSGTRYVRQVIARNLTDTDIHIDSGGWSDRGLGWKHGYPQLRPHTLYVLMFRPLPQWLRSMYSKPYESWHVKAASATFADFIAAPFYSSNRSGASVYDERYRNILHMRRMKYEAYLFLLKSWAPAVGFNIEYLKQHPSVIADVMDRLGVARDPSGFKDITTHVADPKLQARTDPKRYQLTTSDRAAISDAVCREGLDKVEAAVDRLGVFVNTTAMRYRINFDDDPDSYGII